MLKVNWLRPTLIRILGSSLILGQVAIIVIGPNQCQFWETKSRTLFRNVFFKTKYNIKSIIWTDNTEGREKLGLPSIDLINPLLNAMILF